MFGDSKHLFGDSRALEGTGPTQSTSLESFVYDSHNLSLCPPDPRLFAPSIKARFPPETYALVGQQVTLECFAFGK